MGRLFIILQYLLPHHALSRLIGRLAASEIRVIKNPLIRIFISLFKVDMKEAFYTSPKDYKSFNDFFTRPLKGGARVIDLQADTIVSPADGAVSQIGRIQHGRVLQAKGRTYSTKELLGGDSEMAALFTDGSFATIYLSPKDYHRVHMPVAGTLKRMVFVPGDLFSVNNTTAENVDRLFARNERVVALFDTEHGPMAVILVGAMIVASIETSWHGVVAPARGRSVTSYSYDDQPIELAKGAELGRFKLGSTAIILLPKDVGQWEDQVLAGSALRMGQTIGRIIC